MFLGASPTILPHIRNRTRISSKVNTLTSSIATYLKAWVPRRLKKDLENVIFLQKICDVLLIHLFCTRTHIGKYLL